MELQTYDKFEYKQEKCNSFNLIRMLNNLGNEGWELVHISTSDIGNYELLLKRKIICFDNQINGELI